MFIGTSTPQDLAPLGAKPGSRTSLRQDKGDCAPTELRSKEGPLAINISPLWGEATLNFGRASEKRTAECYRTASGSERDKDSSSKR
jgi:hypothetical protein